MSYRLITKDEEFAEKFVQSHTAKHPAAEVDMYTGTGYTVKDSKGTPLTLSLEPVEIEKETVKDKDGKDLEQSKDGKTVEETPIFIVESDVMP